MSKVWLVMQEVDGAEGLETFPDSVWTTRELAEIRERELEERTRTTEVDIMELDVNTPDGVVDPVMGHSGQGYTG